MLEILPIGNQFVIMTSDLYYSYEFGWNIHIANYYNNLSEAQHELERLNNDNHDCS